MFSEPDVLCLGWWRKEKLAEESWVSAGREALYRKHQLVRVNLTNAYTLGIQEAVEAAKS